ncbi:MAG: chitin-binding protein CbpD [Nitrospirales bacterium]|nr:MAG: chitin-binding protein CbpD [Nitrospirales bacterium]
MHFSVKLGSLTLIGILLGIFALPEEGSTHGTMVVPPSRVHECRFNGNPENHQDPACRAAVARGGTQPMYDWNGVRQGNADRQHEALIPDGQQCSGGNPTFRGLDLLRSDWRTTPIAPDANGQFEFVYNATAPHATKDMIFYVTPQGYDPTEPIRWGELEEFCRLGQVPLVTIPGGGRGYRMQCKLPQRTGKHVIFHIWQRSDSPEAFYSCNDVEFKGGIVQGNFREIGKVTAMEDLPAGTTITFRLFQQPTGDVEQIRLVLDEGEGGRALWPFLLAQKVNADSQFIRIGTLTADGRIEPTRTPNGNRVFTKASQPQSFAIDKEVPSDGPDGNPDGGPDDNPDGGPDGGPDGNDPPTHMTYPEGIGNYQPGTVVKGTNGKLYQCRPFPFSGWCNQAPLYYAPGTGLAWEQAWRLAR